MAGRGKPPKDARFLRSDRRPSTSADLTPPPASVPIPELPADLLPVPWHKAVVAWWKALWTSPLREQYLEIDEHGLQVLAVLHHEFWTAVEKDQKLPMAIVSEMRLQENLYGLNPLARRSLGWTYTGAQERKPESKLDALRAYDRHDGRRDPRNVLEMPSRRRDGDGA
jgi:hypothetical protein